HRAAHPAYNLLGGTLIGSAALQPHRWLQTKARLVLSVDGFTDSEGYFLDTNNQALADRRLDLMIKGGFELWTAAWSGLRAGLSYEVAHRQSSVDAYTYTDHRVLVRCRWQLHLDPWAPRTAAPPRGHVPLPHGLGAQGGAPADDERIQDLLRQEDAARRGSTCVD
ncbi:MAG: hypothetical protein V1772_10000, partial [Chloroflexota bacterium]